MMGFIFMPSVSIELEGKVIPLSGKGSQKLNKILREQILPIVVESITVDISNKSQEFAKGIDIPSQMIDKVQSKHAIGRSESGYNSTGKLAESIKTSYLSKIKSKIEALAEYSSWVEFGTGIFGPRGQPIVPKKGKLLSFPYKGNTIVVKSTLGQPPNPFMRSSIWYLNNNLKETLERIQIKLRSKYGRT